MGKVEQAGWTEWRRKVTVSAETIEVLDRDARAQLQEHFAASGALTKKQADRLKGPEHTKQRLIDACLADAIP
ncbi:MAG: hypothetical protein KF680_10035 [Cryobacterium sp.]|nr:hypothetical protein [Cryobacterium sp.]